jgi:hypothetical protein
LNDEGYGLSGPDFRQTNGLDSGYLDEGDGDGLVLGEDRESTQNQARHQFVERIDTQIGGINNLFDNLCLL